jgi:hypothetical protein
MYCVTIKVRITTKQHVDSHMVEQKFRETISRRLLETHSFRILMYFFSENAKNIHFNALVERRFIYNLKIEQTRYHTTQPRLGFEGVASEGHGPPRFFTSLGVDHVNQRGHGGPSVCRAQPCCDASRSTGPLS